MFMLYSGEFNFGSSSSVSPSRLSAAGDVLIVTIQYRLGALGFLHLDGDVVSANLGLQDQILSIEWISQNIIHFGGDPTRVTLFGSEVTFNCLYFTFTGFTSRQCEGSDDLHSLRACTITDLTEFWQFRKQPIKRSHNSVVLSVYCFLRLLFTLVT